MLSEGQIAEFRGRFAIFRKKIYLNSCSQGALSDEVIVGFREFLKSWDEQGSPWDVWVEEYEAARRTFARFIGADADEVAIVPSASAGINAVANSLRFKERPEVILGEYDFPTMGHVWLAQQSRGARVRFAEAEDGRIASAPYERCISKRAAIVGVTRVSFLNGWRADVAAIAAAARKHGALVLLDDYQDCGTRPVNVKALDVDFYVSGTLKYLLGPAGVAFLYARKELVPKLQPTISGWFAQENPFVFDVRRFEPAQAARRFEAGTPPIPNLYSSRRGVELLESVGLEKIEAQVARLAKTFLDGAREMGIVAKTPAGSVGPLAVLQANDAEALVKVLAEHQIVVSSRHDGLRVSFHAYNTIEDVWAVLRVLERHINLLATDSKVAGKAQ
jgi:selenocysteine lyase/cysteine desulfurase